MPTNHVKLLVGVRTDDQGNQYSTIFTRLTMRNGAKSYTRFKDAVDGLQNNSTVYSNDHAGIISELQEYNDNVKETDLSKAPADDPFAAAAAIPEAGSDLPFGDSQTDEDPFAGM